MSGKQWYQSKTLWVNFLTGLAAILAFVAGDTFPVVLTAEGLKLVVLALAVINGVLRYVTSQPIVSGK